MQKVDFPAVLVLSRYDPAMDPPILVFEDKKVLENDGQVDTRIAMYRMLADSAGPDAPRYTFTLANVADVETVKAERLAEIEAERNFGRRPAPAPEDEPQAPAPWTSAVDRAADLARAHFATDAATLDRLPAGIELAKAKNWTRLGDDANTWAMMGSKPGAIYQVNGACDCPDSAYRNVAWCKHRLARALGRRAEALLANDKDVDAATSTSSSSPIDPGQSQVESTTEPACGQGDDWLALANAAWTALQEALAGPYVSRDTLATATVDGFRVQVRIEREDNWGVSLYVRYMLQRAWTVKKDRNHWIGHNGHDAGDREAFDVWMGEVMSVFEFDARLYKSSTALPVDHSYGRSKMFKS